MASIDVRQLMKLNQIPGIGNRRLRLLMQYFKNPESIFHAGLHDLIAVPLIDAGTAKSICSAKEDPQLDASVDRHLAVLDGIGGRVITYWDNEYPAELKNIYDPPAILYLLGTLSDRDVDAIAIVGTRSPSIYGKAIAEKITGELADTGITVISGLARGIDSAAHTAAVQRGGRTIAVTGSGLDVVYPPENARLAEQIARNGAVLTEYEPGTKPDAQNFPRRNRIISGMSLGTVVVESSESGGAMITATYALDQNREVFAVPGNINEKRSDGTNKLIQRGHAKLITSTGDILEEIAGKLKYTRIAGEKSPRTQRPVSLNVFEEKIFESLTAEPAHIDAIAEISGLSTSEALVHLLGLEFKGVVKQLAGKMFTRI